MTHRLLFSPLPACFFPHPFTFLTVPSSYDDAVAAGDGAYLLEEKADSPNVFSASIGNLPAGTVREGGFFSLAAVMFIYDFYTCLDSYPFSFILFISTASPSLPARKTVIITLKYVIELHMVDGALVFTFPANPFAPNRTQPKFTSPVNKDYLDVVPYGLTLTANYQMSRSEWGVYFWFSYLVFIFVLIYLFILFYFFFIFSFKRLSPPRSGQEDHLHVASHQL